VTGRLQASHAASGTEVDVLDLSYGGCLIASAISFPVGSLQQLGLGTRDGSMALILTTRVVHTRVEPHAALERRHLTGLRFVAPWTTQAAAEFDRLMDAVTGVRRDEE
jgi:hypothetical protein